MVRGRVRLDVIVYDIIVITILYPFRLDVVNTIILRLIIFIRLEGKCDQLARQLHRVSGESIRGTDI